jgi:GNAT superfamily N-acetyltransferase
VLDFHVEMLGLDRLEELLEMLREREAWLEERGLAMWDPAYLVAERFLERYPGAKPFLCCLDDEKLGGFILLDRDEAGWPGRDEPAYYLHKLVLRPEFSGHGFAEKAIEWAAGFAAAKGKEFLRLDYYEDRPGLAELYARCGFVPAGVEVKPDGTRIARAEFRLTPAEDR